MFKKITIAFILFLSSLPSSASALSAEVKRDVYLSSLADALKAEDYEESLEQVDILRSLAIELPPSVDYFEGEASCRLEKFIQCENALTTYIEKTGKNGRYYARTIKLLSKAMSGAKQEWNNKLASDNLAQEKITKIRKEFYKYLSWKKPKYVKTSTASGKYETVSNFEFDTQSYGNNNDEFYEGQLKSGNRHGQGFYVWPDGGYYYGTWYKGDRTGYGEIFYTNGNSYKGEWVKGNRTGEGTMLYSAGGKYRGGWKNNKQHGRGRFSYSNGSEYVGEFKNGKRSGKGEIKYSSGVIYEGYWKSGERNGNGTIHFTNTSMCTGYWEDDRLSNVGRGRDRRGYSATCRRKYRNKNTIYFKRR